MARNMLDPKIVTESEIRELPLFIKIYGGLCIASGVISIPVYLMFFGYIAQQLIQNPDTVTIGANPLVALAIAIVGISFAVLDTVGLIVFGISLIKNRRRHAARWSYALIVVTIIQIIIDMMLSGIGSHLIRPAVQLAILIALSITVDPSLRQERELQRRLRNMINREAARDAMLGRDETGEGFIRLNFFNLFWVFVACSVIGLMLETIWHMVVVEPGVYQDRAGLLFGGRTCTMFAGIWGCLGLAWIRVLLPRLLKLINRIPWTWRYSLTSICTLLMLIDGVMTLQSLDCWFERVSGLTPQTHVEQFYAAHFDDDYMQHRFQSMTITPQDTSRVLSAKDSAA